MLLIIPYDCVIFLHILIYVYANHNIWGSFHHLDIPIAVLKLNGHLYTLTCRDGEGLLLGSRLSCTKPLALALFPFIFLVSFCSPLHLSLLLSMWRLSRHEIDHLGLQSLSSAMYETHMFLSDDVELGLVAILVDEIYA